MLNDIYHSLNPIAFTLGPFSVRWYALAYLAGFILAGVVMYRTQKRWGLGLVVDEIVNLIVAIAWGILIGARLFYVIFYGMGWEYYLAHPIAIIATWDGGMSFHGGLVGAIVAGTLMCRACKISVPTICDLGVIGAPIGLFFGRCANFVNGELWGKETDLPWGVVFETGGNVARHPSQLYEAILEGLVIFIVLFVMSRKNPPRVQGTFMGTFLVLYGIFRFLIEFVRVPDAQLGYLFGPITMGQCLSFPVLLAGIGVLVWSHKTKHPQIGHVA